MGTSPPVITEFLQYMIDTRGIRVNDVTILNTNDELVTKSTTLAEVGLRHKYPGVKTHIVKLPFPDIESYERSVEFTRIAIRVLKEQKHAYNVDSIFICIAGGRKEACVILSIIAQFFDVSGVYHVISPDIGYANLELERARHNIDELHYSENKDEYYASNKGIFDKLLFPSISFYNVIPIPVFPMELDYAEKIANILKEPNQKRKEIDYHLLSRLENLGMIKIDRKKIYLKEESRHMLEIINEVLN